MARGEQEKLQLVAASGPAMSSAGAGDAAAPPPCDYCGGMPAVVYCRADSARLCLPCDRHVHGANAVCSRHARAPLCAACRAAPGAFRRAATARFLCPNCDFEAAAGEPPLHDRGAVEGYTGCPSVGELAAILGADECEKAAGGGTEGWWAVWEEPQVLSLDDVIVPTTSCHGLQPLFSPSSPKNRSSPAGELDEEVLRQLGELAKSEAAAYGEAEPAGDQLPPWEYGIGHGDFGAFGTEASHEAFEHEAWVAVDCTDQADASGEAEAVHEPIPASSEAGPCLSSFLEISAICPSVSRSSSGADFNGGGGGQDPAAAAAVPAQGLPRKGGYDISYPDRGTVISRYKEKRKNRRFDKQIRYESRKARADGRLRIKGRFAKTN